MFNSTLFIVITLITDTHRCKATEYKTHFDINTDNSVNIYNDAAVQNQ